METEAKSNQYEKYYQNHSNKELEEIIEQTDLYHNEVRLTALKLLQQRGVELSQSQLKEKENIQEAQKNKEEEIAIKIIEEAQKGKIPEWYSPGAIFGFSILAPVFGAILINHNLRKNEKQLQANLALVVGLFFTFLPALMYFLGFLSNYVVIGSKLIGAIFLIEFFWKKHLGYNTKFKRKPVWKIIIVTLSVLIVLAMLITILRPDLAEAIIEFQNQNLQ